MIPTRTWVPSLLPCSHPPLNRPSHTLPMVTKWLQLFQITAPKQYPKAETEIFLTYRLIKYFSRSLQKTFPDVSLAGVVILHMPKQIICKKNRITVIGLDNRHLLSYSLKIGKVNMWIYQFLKQEWWVSHPYMTTGKTIA